MVNDTITLISYTQAVFWSVEGLTLQLEKISGNAILDQESLYATTLKSTLRNEIRMAHAPTVTLLKPETHKNSGALLMFRTVEEGLLGGLWLESDKPYGEAETTHSRRIDRYLHTIRLRSGMFAAAVNSFLLFKGIKTLSGLLPQVLSRLLFCQCVKI